MGAVWYDVNSSTTGPDDLPAVVRNEMRFQVLRKLTREARSRELLSSTARQGAILEIAQAERAVARPKFLVTRDSDFDEREIESELTGLGFKIRKDTGRLYRELRT